MAPPLTMVLLVFCGHGRCEEAQDVPPRDLGLRPAAAPEAPTTPSWTRREWLELWCNLDDELTVRMV